MGKTYSVETARVLLELAYPGWDFPPYVIRDDGVYQSDEHREVSPPEEIFDWSPAYDMSGPKAPDPMTSPMLPIPFCAAELAAFMLDGAGLMIPEALDWRIGENTPTLESLGHPRRRKAREALQEAFVLLAKAVQQNGPPNYEELASAQDLAARYDEENGAANEREGVFGPGISDNESRLRRASAVASVKEAKERAEHAGSVANRNWKEWRKKMVCALLEDRPSAPSETSSQPVIGAAMELETQAKEVRAMKRKILFWLAPNEILIPADQVPGAIADALYPRPSQDGAPALNDPDTVPRLLAEREHAKLLRMKFPHLTNGDKFSIGDLNDYLERLGMVAESRPRREALDSLDPESRWQRRQFEDAFNAVREAVGEARSCASALSAERCTELANQHVLSLSHWIELVGLGIGRHESYDIGRNGIEFRNWEDDFIAASPIEWQADMERDIEIAPRLRFPCAPAELVKFVDAAIGIHCFNVPEAFRLAVTCEHAASSGTPESDKPHTHKATPSRPQPAQKPESPQMASEESAPRRNLFVLPGVKTTDIIEAFSLVEKKWEDILSRKKDKRYSSAIHTPGGRGKGMHTWKPADFAICLLKTKERKNPGALRVIITRRWPDWLPEFESQLENHLNESGENNPFKSGQKAGKPRQH